MARGGGNVMQDDHPAHSRIELEIALYRLIGMIGVNEHRIIRTESICPLHDLRGTRRPQDTINVPAIHFQASKGRKEDRYRFAVPELPTGEIQCHPMRPSRKRVHHPLERTPIPCPDFQIRHYLFRQEKAYQPFQFVRDLQGLGEAKGSDWFFERHNVHAASCSTIRAATSAMVSCLWGTKPLTTLTTCSVRGL